MKAINLIGMKFGRLTVLSREGSSATKQALWKCRCECGARMVWDRDELKSLRSRKEKLTDE